MNDNTLISITLKSLPPTVNHMYMNAHGRRFRTAECREYQEYAVEQLKAVWNNKPLFTGRAALFITLSTNNRRRWDIDNRMKALQDCLTMAGIIKDDSQIDFIQIERLYEKDTRTNLTLKEIKD